MQQTTLDLEETEDAPTKLTTPERQQELIALMADAIIVVAQHASGENNEPT